MVSVVVSVFKMDIGRYIGLKMFLGSIARGLSFRCPMRFVSLPVSGCLTASLTACLLVFAACVFLLIYLLAEFSYPPQRWPSASARKNTVRLLVCSMCYACEYFHLSRSPFGKSRSGRIAGQGRGRPSQRGLGENECNVQPISSCCQSLWL